MARYKNIPSELRLPDLRGQDTVVAMERLHRVRVVALVGTSGWWAEVARTLCDARLLATHLRAMGLDVQVSYVGVDRPRIFSWGPWGLNDRSAAINKARLQGLELVEPPPSAVLSENNECAFALLNGAISRRAVTYQKLSSGAEQWKLSDEAAKVAVAAWPEGRRQRVDGARHWMDMASTYGPQSQYVWDPFAVPALVQRVSRPNERVIVVGTIQRGYEWGKAVRMTADATLGHDATHHWVGSGMPQFILNARPVNAWYGVPYADVMGAVEQALFDSYSPAALRLGLQLLSVNSRLEPLRDCSARIGSVEWAKCLRFAVMDDAEKFVRRSTDALYRAKRIVAEAATATGLVQTADSDGPDRLSVALIDEFVREISGGLHLQSALSVALRTVRELTNASRANDLHRVRHLTAAVHTMREVFGVDASG